MRYLILTILIVATAFQVRHAEACQRGMIENAFDTTAPTASDIIAIQVQSLEMDHDDYSPEGYGQLFRAQVRVLKQYRGMGVFSGFTYRNGQCAGLRIDVGGIYLIATNSDTPMIELASSAAPILHLAGFFTFQPETVLQLSDTVRRLEAALRGDGSFAITTQAARQAMSIYDLPPRVPPPEETEEH